MFRAPSGRQPLACRCGHIRHAHAHYRGYSEYTIAECALCDCPRWSPGLLARLRFLLPRSTQEYVCTRCAFTPPPHYCAKPWCICDCRQEGRS